MNHPKEFAEGLSIGIIMDGNGRWAKQRGLPRTAGHKKGAAVFQDIANYCEELGVSSVTFYAFSTENWKRPREEVAEIMTLLEKYLHKAIREMRQRNIRLRFFGDLEPLSPALRALIAETNDISRTTTGMLVNVCLNYGGRAEITRAARILAQRCKDGELDPGDITEEMLESELYSAGIPDPDLMIRPGGEVRLSNFLLWQNAYAEFYFTDTLWPDMTAERLDAAIAAFQQRNRRYGGI